MRKAHSFLLKEKRSIRTLQTFVRSERSVAVLSESCSLKDDPFLLKLYLAQRALTVKHTCFALKREAFSSSFFFTKFLEVKGALYFL